MNSQEKQNVGTVPTISELVKGWISVSGITEAGTDWNFVRLPGMEYPVLTFSGSKGKPSRSYAVEIIDGAGYMEIMLCKTMDQSSEPGIHNMTKTAARLTCNCTAAFYGRHCKHVEVVGHLLHELGKFLQKPE